MDDMLVKNTRETQHLDDRQETFDTLKRYKMKLNPSKCDLGVASGKVLGFMVSQRGIKANLHKIQAILNMEPPKNVKDVQSLIGWVATLNRFVLNATNNCLPFFKVLRRAFEQAFEDLKAYLSSTPLLSPSKPSEELYIYLVVSPYAVSLAFIREEGKIQMHVYYTNKVLRGAEVLEKHMFVSHTRHT